MITLNEEIGKRIAQKRAESGMTQGILAEKLNCSVKHVSHVERGVASFSLDMLIEVSDILGCTINYLVKGEEAAPLSIIPVYVIKVLDSKEDQMQKEKDLLLSYLAMYRSLREEALTELTEDTEQRSV